MKFGIASASLCLLLLVGCGGGSGKQVLQGVNNVQSLVKEIQAKQGTADEKLYANKYVITLTNKKVTCTSKKADTQMQLTDGDTLDCQQDKGTLACTDKDEKYEGFVDKDGSFGMVRSSTETSNATIVTAIKGKFASKAAGTANFQSMISLKIANRPQRCVGSAQMTFKGDAPAASVSLAYTSANQSGERYFTDVQTRETASAMEIGAKGTDHERFVAHLPKDGNGTVQVSLAGATGISQPEVLATDASCTQQETENEETRQIVFACPLVRGQKVHGRIQIAK